MAHARFSLYSSSDRVYKSSKNMKSFELALANNPPQPINGVLPAPLRQQESIEDVNITHQVLQRLDLETSPNSVFLDLPAEIRNKIYKWTYILSRDREDIYNLPDAEIHGDQQHGGIRWVNIPRFNLLLASRQIYNEVIPIISSAMFLSIKTYPYRSDDTRALQSLTGLYRASAFCMNAKRVSINLTPGCGKLASHLRAIAVALDKFSRLEIVELKLLTYGKNQIDLWKLKDVFRIGRRNGASLSVELIDVVVPQRATNANVIQCEKLETAVCKLAREATGQNPEVGFPVMMPILVSLSDAVDRYGSSGRSSQSL
jgi:hypothetical protein